MPNNLPKGNPIPEIILQRLYLDEKKSLADIALALDVSVHKVQYWMWKYKIKTRSISDAVYLKYNPDGDPFSVKTDLGLDEVKLKFLALGLYWGEGMKAGRQVVKIGNTDPVLLRHFQKFLVDIYRVDSSKIRYYLQIFKDINPVRAKKYWAHQLRIDESRVSVSDSLPSLGKGTYRRISKHGVMSMHFSNAKLKSYLLRDLKQLGYVGGYSVKVEAKKMVK